MMLLDLVENIGARRVTASGKRRRRRLTAKRGRRA